MQSSDTTSQIQVALGSPEPSDFWGTIAIAASVVTLLAFAYLIVFGQRSLIDLRAWWRTRGQKQGSNDATQHGRKLPATWLSRAETISDLSARLRDSGIVVLEGARGVGKTSVVAAGVDDIARSGRGRRRLDIHWVNLKYGSFGADEFFDAVGHALGFDAVAAAPSIQKAILLQRLLQSKHLVLVIDNFESIAPEHLVVRDFISGLPKNVRCIVTTSRSVSDIRGASIVHVDGFSLEETRSFLRLKVANGDLEKLPSEELLRALHEQTGGTALAIEWAVGRARTGIPLRDVVATMRDGRGDLFGGLFDAAWADLTPTERRCLELAALMPRAMPLDLLRVFPPHQDAHPSEMVVGIARRYLASVEGITDAPDGSVLQLHPLAHIYAGLRLARVPSRTRNIYATRSAEYFITLFGKVAEGGSAPSPQVVDRQIENAIAVARLCAERSLETEFVSLVTAIRGSLLTSGRISERAALCAGAADTAKKLGDVEAYLRLSTAAGSALGLLGQHADSEAILSKTAQVAENHGHWGQAARTRRALAASYYRSSRLADAATELHPARMWALGAGDLCAVIDIDYLSANIAYVEGRFDEAAALCEQMLTEEQSAGYGRAKAYALEQLATVALEQQNRTAAAEFAKHAKHVADEHLDRRQAARAVLALSKALMAGRRPITARRLAAEAAQVFAEVGLRNEELEALEVVRRCVGLANVLRLIVRAPTTAGSFLRLPIGGD